MCHPMVSRDTCDYCPRKWGKDLQEHVNYVGPWFKKTISNIESTEVFWYWKGNLGVIRIF